MYKNIVLDLGGVMVDFDPKSYLVDRLCSAEMEEKVYDLTFGSEEWQLLDAGQISRWAVDGVGLCTKLGILKGSSGYFMPKQPLTRAQTAVVLQRLSRY